MKTDWRCQAVSGYETRVASEIQIYRDRTDVHNLPPIFHYWSNRYVRPQLERRGLGSIEDMFLRELERHCAQHSGATVRFLSVGSGNCDLETGVAASLRARGYEDFVIECVDLNPAMLRRGADRAEKLGLGGKFAFVEADLNRWVAQHQYHAAMADQSLHHVVELESLFGQIGESLLPQGTFIISDMIGRNGHLRWPEALTIVREFWQELPPSYRINCQSGRYEAVFEDADCSTESFEGIRAQDIVGLLKEYFHFRFFLGFGNVIDPFVDRSFGPNFDPHAVWDCEFIDRVHRCDEREMAAGRLQPTHMLAVLGKQAGSPLFGAFTPPAVMAASGDIAIAKPVECAYSRGQWPHSAEAELERICAAVESAENRAKDLETKLNGAISDQRRNETEFQERTAWALQLDRQLLAASLYIVVKEEELDSRTAWVRRLEAELAGQTAETTRLENELTDRTQWALRMQSELVERTEWALRMQLELEERTQWALSLDRELSDLRRRTKPLLIVATYLRRLLWFARWLPARVMSRARNSVRASGQPAS